MRNPKVKEEEACINRNPGETRRTGTLCSSLLPAPKWDQPPPSDHWATVATVGGTVSVGRYEAFEPFVEKNFHISPAHTTIILISLHEDITPLLAAAETLVRVENGYQQAPNRLVLHRGLVNISSS